MSAPLLTDTIPGSVPLGSRSPLSGGTALSRVERDGVDIPPSAMWLSHVPCRRADVTEIVGTLRRKSLPLLGTTHTTIEMPLFTETRAPMCGRRVTAVP